MDTQAERTEHLQKLAKLIKDINIAMLTTAEDDGTLRSRPMATQKTEFDGELWFFTAIHSPKMDEVRKEQHVNVSYARPDKNTYVSMSGKAVIVQDRQKIEELWNPILKAWFPKGLEDPELSLLKVNVEAAEYWDSPSSPVVQVVGLAKALVTGKPAKGGENEKVELSA